MRESLSDKAYDMIKADIVTCEFRPGQQIAQPWLAERYAIGETPIREALQRLAHENLVESVPRFGYVVALITYNMVVDVYEARLINESAAARLAARRATPEQIEALLASQDYEHVNGDRASYLDFIARNSAFHRQIAIAAHNERLLGLIRQLHDESTRIFHLGLIKEENVSLMREEHRRIARAIQARDADRAGALVHDHIARTEQRVLGALAGHFGVRPPRDPADTLPSQPA